MFHSSGFLLQDPIGGCTVRLGVLPRQKALTLVLELREPDPMTGLMQPIRPRSTLTLRVTAHGFGTETPEGGGGRPTSAPYGGPQLWRGDEVDTTGRTRCDEMFCTTEFSWLCWKYVCFRCGKVLCGDHAQHRHPFEGRNVVMCNACFAIAEGLVSLGDYGASLGRQLSRSASMPRMASLSSSRARSSASTVDEAPDPELEPSPVLPTLCGSKRSDRAILNPELLRKLVLGFPLLRSQTWALLFSTLEHGSSYQTLYTNVADMGNLLMLVMTMDGQVFGAFLPTALAPTDEPKYQGSGHAVVFSLSPDFAAYTWTKANRYFVLSQSHCFAVGGGGSAAIWLDEELSSGSSGPCETFGSPPLCGSDGKTTFDVYCVQVWHVATLNMFGDAFSKSQSTGTTDAVPRTITAPGAAPPGTSLVLLVCEGQASAHAAAAWVKGTGQGHRAQGHIYCLDLSPGPGPLEDLAAGLGCPPGDVHRGDPDDVAGGIDRIVKENGICLVVYGTEEARSAHQTLHTTPGTSLVVVPPGWTMDDGHGQHLMVCVDGSAASRTAVRKLTQVLQPQDHVVLFSAYAPPPGEAFAQQLRRNLSQCKEWTQDCLQLLNEAAIIPTSHIVIQVHCSDHPAESCLRFAAQLGVSTIVCGTGGSLQLGSFNRWTLQGTVDQAVWVVG